MNANVYTCRKGNESDLENIADMFRRHNYGPQHADWLVWKYFKNPDGPATIYLGEDSEGNIVAMRAHLPRLFASPGMGTFEVRQTVDMFVDKQHRGTGVYSQVRGFTWEDRRCAVIGFPNIHSKTISKTRPGDTKVQYPLDDWLFPVAVGQLIEGRPVGFLAPVADALSRFYASLWLGGRPRRVQMKPTTRFDNDYELDPNSIHGIRSAEYLNWRFIDNPMRAYTVYEFYEGDEVLGYCAYTITGTSAEMVDLILYKRWRQCLRLLIDHLREKDISHVSFKCLGFRMRRFGFVRRRPQTYFDTNNMPEGDWLITHADSDY